jgi:flagellar hook assembly protein FlgD
MKLKIPKVGDKVKIIDSGIDGSFYGIPLVIVDENNRREIKHKNGVITKVKHGRKQNKGSHTFTITPNKGKVVLPTTY